jgi:hypothetical protein
VNVLEAARLFDVKRVVYTSAKGVYGAILREYGAPTYKPLSEGGFKVVRRRWVVEPTISWLRRNRRLMAHYEAFAIIAEGYAKLAMITCSSGSPSQRPTAPRKVPSQALKPRSTAASVTLRCVRTA